MSRKLMLVPLMMFSVCTFASTTQNTNIKNYMLDRSNGLKLFLNVEQTLTMPYGCRTNANWPLVVDLSDEFGQLMYSTILAAHASNRTVKLYGTDECSIQGGSETVYRIEVE